MASNRIELMCKLASCRLDCFIAEKALQAVQALTRDEGERFEAYLDLQQAEHFLEVAEQESEDAWAEEAYSEYCATHTWQQNVMSTYPSSSPRERASMAITSYISACNDVIYGFDCTSNPEGISQDDLHAQEESARQRMMAALSLLPDEEIDGVIQGNKDRDFDGSSFSVTKLAEVQAWRTEFAHLSIASATRH